MCYYDLKRWSGQFLLPFTHLHILYGAILYSESQRSPYLVKSLYSCSSGVYDKHAETLVVHYLKDM